MHVLASVGGSHRYADLIVYSLGDFKNIHSPEIIGHSLFEDNLSVIPQLHRVISHKLGRYADSLLSLTLGVLCLLHRIIEIRVKYQPYFRYLYWIR